MLRITIVYAGKIGGVLVAFFFLPWYSHALDSEQFGLVAVVISLHALSLLFDLGLGTLISRDFAANEVGANSLGSMMRSAEALMSGFYACVLALVSCAQLLGSFSAVGFSVTTSAVLFFWLSALQNLYYSALMARGVLVSTTVVQLIGTLARACATLFALKYYSATVGTFVVSQLVVALIHCLVCRVYLWAHLPHESELRHVTAHSSWAECVGLLKRGRPLLVTGFAGAAAMQLDKPIMSLFLPVADIGPYFLSVTLSAAPVALLASPWTYYFQPRITNAVARNHVSTIRREMMRFMMVFVLFVGVPVAAMFALLPQIVEVWLASSNSGEVVVRYSRILLVGYGVSAFAIIPFVLIVARQDYLFQARISVASTFFLLLMVTYSAHQKNVYAICFAYVVYFSMVAASFLWRTRLAIFRQTR